MRVHLEHHVHFCDTLLWESCRWTVMSPEEGHWGGLSWTTGHMSWELGLVWQKERRPRGLNSVFHCLKWSGRKDRGSWRKDRARFRCTEKVQQQWAHVAIQWDIQKKFFHSEVDKNWNIVPKTSVRNQVKWVLPLKSGFLLVRKTRTFRFSKGSI